MELSLLSTSHLKEQGWTPALVKKFLDPPEVTKPNPHYRSASPMRLYARARVEAAEQEDDWKQAAAKARARSQVGKIVAARKAAELVAQACVLPIMVNRLPLEQLLRCAVASYNAFHDELLWERGHDYERASEQSDPAFLERITVNYLRHHLTEYDTHLEELAGQVGVSEATDTIRHRVYGEIAARYPESAEECKRQMQTRQGKADAS